MIYLAIIAIIIVARVLGPINRKPDHDAQLRAYEDEHRAASYGEGPQ